MSRYDDENGACSQTGTGINGMHRHTVEGITGAPCSGAGNGDV